MRITAALFETCHRLSAFDVHLRLAWRSPGLTAEMILLAVFDIYYRTSVISYSSAGRILRTTIGMLLFIVLFIFSTRTSTHSRQAARSFSPSVFYTSPRMIEMSAYLSATYLAAVEYVVGRWSDSCCWSLDCSLLQASNSPGIVIRNVDRH